MIECMSEPDTTTGSGGKSGPKRVRSGVAINVYIDPQVAEAIDGYLSGLDPQITKTALVESLFRNLLREKGLWPPQRKG